MILGCDLHMRYQQMAMLDTEKSGDRRDVSIPISSKVGLMLGSDERLGAPGSRPFFGR